MENNTRFAVGQKVRSTVTAQGMLKGAEYVVRAVQVRNTPFGGFTTYQVQPVNGAPLVDRGSNLLAIGNGHLLLTEAA